MKRTISEAEYKAALRVVNDIREAFPTYDVMDDETIEIFENSLKIIKKYRKEIELYQEDLIEKSESYEQAEKWHLLNNNKEYHVQPKVTLAPKKKTDRFKYEDACIFLYIVGSLYAQKQQTPLLKSWERAAQGCVSNYKSQVKNPGTKRIDFGQMYAYYLHAQDQVSLKEMRDDVATLEHPEQHRRVMRSAAKFLKFVDQNTRG